MRHLLSRGFYKPMGVSGETLRKSLFLLRPEIYGSIAEEQLELNGLLYVIERLPEGIEECQFINLTADEGYKDSHFESIIPPKRRRNCYRIDKDQMNIEITRGRSEIYDILNSLNFFIYRISQNQTRVINQDGKDFTREWKNLEEIVLDQKEISKENEKLLCSFSEISWEELIERLSACYKLFLQRKTHIVFFNLFIG